MILAPFRCRRTGGRRPLNHADPGRPPNPYELGAVHMAVLSRDALEGSPLADLHTLASLYAIGVVGGVLVRQPSSKVEAVATAHALEPDADCVKPGKANRRAGKKIAHCSNRCKAAYKWSNRWALCRKQPTHAVGKPWPSAAPRAGRESSPSARTRPTACTCFPRWSRTASSPRSRA